jgi:hypothetical protein
MRSLETLLSSYPSDVQGIARDARQLIRRLLPNVEERVDASAPVVGYGYGPGYRGVVCTLLLSKSGVKIGLARGTELTDPHHLLRGAGKVHRHVPLHAPTDLRRPGVRQLITAAYVAWQGRHNASRGTTR